MSSASAPQHPPACVGNKIWRTAVQPSCCVFREVIRARVQAFAAQSGVGVKGKGKPKNRLPSSAGARNVAVCTQCYAPSSVFHLRRAAPRWSHAGLGGNPSFMKLPAHFPGKPMASSGHSKCTPYHWGTAEVRRSALSFSSRSTNGSQRGHFSETRLFKADGQFRC